MAERILSKPEVIAELTKSPHGDLAAYVPVGVPAARDDADFFAHLLAWNHHRGQVRDAKVALPVLALAARPIAIFAQNALAHLADLNPRMFVQALEFARTVAAPTRILRRLVARYIRDLEHDGHEWERTTLQHRQAMRTLYAKYHVKPNTRADAALFKGTGEGKFAIVRQLAQMSPEECAGTIQTHKIPFMIARGALGAKASHPDVVLALMARMSPTELVTNTKSLERLGIKTVPALRAAYEKGIEGAAKSKKAPRATLKTTKAAEALADDAQLSGKLRALQEKQLDNLRGIEGNWLVLADKSGSMAAAIEIARHVTAILARMVKGKVYLAFFDTIPRGLDATGQTYEMLTANTQGIEAGGGTSIGCGLWRLADEKKAIDGIAIVSDGGENHVPWFAQAYDRYRGLMGNDPSVYLYRTPGGDANVLSANCQRAGIALEEFPLTDVVDYYSLPNLVQTMRIGRYQLLDEVFATRLRTVDEVLTRTIGMEVLGHARRLETA
jgi:hypothetical protein